MSKSLEEFAAEKRIPTVRSVDATFDAGGKFAAVSGRLFEQSHREVFLGDENVRMLLTRQQAEHLVARLQRVLVDMPKP